MVQVMVERVRLYFLLRWRLRRICKKLGINPYKWQRDYALSKSLYLKRGRRSGKTTAIMLWALIRNVKPPEKRFMTDDTFNRVASKDPDVKMRVHYDWWADEYVKLALKVGLIKEGESRENEV
jgi:hypothetical protein